MKVCSATRQIKSDHDRRQLATPAHNHGMFLISEHNQHGEK